MKNQIRNAINIGLLTMGIGWFATGLVKGINSDVPGFSPAVERRAELSNELRRTEVNLCTPDEFYDNINGCLARSDEYALSVRRYTEFIGRLENREPIKSYYELRETDSEATLLTVGGLSLALACGYTYWNRRRKDKE
ncbi:MAG: hypothetical protein ABIH82_03390 [Candidatus Woesearchaeota archaeon]